MIKPVAIIDVNNYTKQRLVRSMDSLQELKKNTPLYAIPEGYALVPIEPTQEMLDAGLDSIDSSTHRLNRMRKYYKAMLQAGGVK